MAVTTKKPAKQSDRKREPSKEGREHCASKVRPRFAGSAEPLIKIFAGQLHKVGLKVLSYPSKSASVLPSKIRKHQEFLHDYLNIVGARSPCSSTLKPALLSAANSRLDLFQNGLVEATTWANEMALRLKLVHRHIMHPFWRLTSGKQSLPQWHQA
eukprot:3444065-Amphidinium_carterae.1